MDPLTALDPMLATAGEASEVREGFAFEFKWDGVRALIGLRGEDIVIRSRRGNDVTATYPDLHGLRGAVEGPVLLDGEIVAFDADKRPSFSQLQQRMNVSDPTRVAAAVRRVPVAFIVFDVLVEGDEGLLELPYEQRRARLESLGLAGPRWQTSPSREGDVDDLLGVAGNLGLEGLVAKRHGSRYRPGRRSPEWRKLRLMKRQEFVVGGYLRGQGGRGSSFGSLLIGYHDDDGSLRFAGSVGSGFAGDMLTLLQRRLDASVTGDSPFADPVPRPDPVFVIPELVVEVQFSQWTGDGVLRQPSFKGLRNDKDPAEVVREPG